MEMCLLQTGHCSVPLCCLQSRTPSVACSRTRVLAKVVRVLALSQTPVALVGLHFCGCHTVVFSIPDVGAWGMTPSLAESVAVFCVVGVVEIFCLSRGSCFVLHAADHVLQGATCGTMPSEVTFDVSRRTLCLFWYSSHFCVHTPTCALLARGYKGTLPKKRLYIAAAVMWVCVSVWRVFRFPSTFVTTLAYGSLMWVALSDGCLRIFDQKLEIEVQFLSLLFPSLKTTHQNSR